MRDLTPSQKGAVAEAEVAAAVIRLGLVVLRPWGEGCRYDLVIDLEVQVVRVQCKWAALRRGVVTVNTATSRHTPRGYVRSRYTAAEVDAIGAFSADTGACYLIPIEIIGRRELSLRVSPTGNNQAHGVRWARDFELSRSLAAHWSVDLTCAGSQPRRPEPASVALVPPGL